MKKILFLLLLVSSLCSAQVTSLTLPYGLKMNTNNRSPLKSYLNNSNLPYTDAAEVLSQNTVRHRGQKFFVSGGVEYWFKDGIADGDLVIIPAGSGDMLLGTVQTNTAKKTFLDGTFALRNVANTYDAIFSNTNTANRTYTLKDASGTLAFMSDVAVTLVGSSLQSVGSSFGATGSYLNTVLGDQAGAGTVNAQQSVFIGDYAGGYVEDVTGSFFLGSNAGNLATNASNSVFIGGGAGSAATDALGSNFIGASAGNQSFNASYSNLFGFNVGAAPSVGHSIGSNNIIIGTNITVPEDYYNRINIGGVLWGNGTNSTTSGASIDYPSYGQIGINVVDPYSMLDIAGDVFLRGENLHLNFGPDTVGYVGYGVRDTLGVMQYKDYGGSWTDFSSGGGGLTVGTSTITSGTNTKVLYNNSGVLGEYTVSGTGNVALTTSPTFTTPALGTPSALVGTNITGTATGLTSGITKALKSATTTVNVSSATAPTSGQVLTATSGTAATWQTPASASGAWLLASGGTATGTNTFAMGSNPFILTSGVTTGTGATAGIQNVFNSLTTGNGLDISSSSVSSGSIVKITGTGTAAASNTQSGLVVDISGANATSTQTTYGGYFSNTKTGTSSTNIAGYFNASGGTNNLAIYAPSGIVTLGSTGAGYNGRLYSTAGTGGRVAILGNLEITTSAGPSWSGTGIQVVGSNRKLSFYGGSFGTDNDQVDVSWNSTGVNRSGVDLGVLKSSLGAFATGTFQANSIAAFRFTDTWPTLTTPLPVVYGFDYSAGGAGNAVSEVAIRATRGQVVLGATGTSSANDRVKINGIGTTTGKGLVVNNSSGSERFSVQDNGVINVNGSGGTAGQVLVSNGTSAAAWGTPTVNITGSNQRYQTQVANISSSLVASGTGFASLSNPSEYANKTVLSVDFVIVMIKNDGTAVVYGKLTSIFRKNNSGTWTADVPGTPTISDITQLSGFVGDINGGVPGITWTTPGTTSGTWQLGYTAAISSTTN